MTARAPQPAAAGRTARRATARQWCCRRHEAPRESRREYFILALLVAGGTYGYELKRAFDKRFGGLWPAVNIGQIYATPARLERDGLVHGSEIAQNRRPNKTVYELTDDGGEALRAWLAQPWSIAAAVASSAVMFLFFGEPLRNIAVLPGFPATDYQAYLTGMVLVMAVVFSGSDMAMVLLTDRCTTTSKNCWCRPSIVF